MDDSTEISDDLLSVDVPVNMDSSLGLSTPFMKNSRSLKIAGLKQYKLLIPAPSPELLSSNLLNWRNRLEDFHPGLIPMKKTLLYRVYTFNREGPQTYIREKGIEIEPPAV